MRTILISIIDDLNGDCKRFYGDAKTALLGRNAALPGCRRRICNFRKILNVSEC
jgi:hypothetical protein